MTMQLNELKQAICSQIHVSNLDDGQGIAIDTPFIFDDGDCCFVQVKQTPEGYLIDDSGETLFRTQYGDVDITGPGHRNRLGQLLQFYGVENRDGTLTVEASSESEVGDRVFCLLQVVLEVMNLSKLPAARKQSKRRFAGIFAKTLYGVIPEAKLHPRWTDPRNDPDGIYLADFSVEADSERWLLFGVPSPVKCLQSVVTTQHHKHRTKNLHAFAAVDSKKVGDKYIKPLLDVSDKVMYLDRERKQIEEFLRTEILHEAA